MTPYKNWTWVRITLVWILCVASLGGFAQEKIAKAVLIDPVINLGEVNKTKKLKCDFVIRNDGNVNLFINAVLPACGCTYARFDQTIRPGKTGKIYSVTNVTGFKGVISKDITVLTSDPSNPVLRLTIQAIVKD